MPGTVRALVAQALEKIEQGVSSEDLISEIFKREKLKDEDKRFFTELFYGTLRWRGFIDKYLESFSERKLYQINPFVLNVLRIAAYQILKLDKVPHSAAVNEAVDSVKRSKEHPAAPFVNAVLRNMLRGLESGFDPNRELDERSPEWISSVLSHPFWFVKRMIKNFGVDETVAICRANNDIPPTTLRVNLLASTRDNLLSNFMEKMKPDQIGGVTHISPQGIMLRRTGDVALLPGFKEGLFVVQDESSQLVTLALDPKPNESILDVCAAPGGKTTHIAERMGNRGSISACDIKKQRLKLINDNAKRLGVNNIKMRVHDAKKKFFTKYNRVLLDAPCSGSGVIRRYPEAKWTRSGDEISKLAKQQLEMLRNAASAVEPGGVLVYSVCSIHPEEGDGVIYSLLDTYKFFEIEDLKTVLPPSAVSLIGDDGFFRSFPITGGMDGFFIARLRRAK